MALKLHDLGQGIIYLPDHCTLFCTKHQSAIPLLELKYHLGVNDGHKLPPAKLQPIFNAAQAMGSLLKTTLAELPIPSHGSDPLPFLPIIDGLRCLNCQYLRGTRKDDGVLKAHINKNHVSRP